MVNVKTKKGTIGILTGGGDVPGLNPAIRAITIRALRDGYRVLGIRRGWAGLVEMVRDAHEPLEEFVIEMTEELVNKIGRTGGTFLHTSRTRPSHIPHALLPPHLKEQYSGDKVDVTKDILKNLDWLGIDILIPIGGDDTLSYATRLHKEGVKVIAIPKTMDNDVPGTDYCIGFSTCVTRTIELTNSLRTCAGSHERLLVIEVFGRYAGFTALLPTMAGAAHRCVIPEYTFDIKHLCRLMIEDRAKNPSKYSVVLVSEGATYKENLFPIAAEYAKNLESGKTCDTIVSAFHDRGCTLSKDLAIRKKGEEWYIKDEEEKRGYIISPKGGQSGELEVFRCDMVFEGQDTDMYGHKKLGGIGDRVSQELKELSPEFNNGKQVNVINQRLSYLVRCGNPDALDSIVPMAYGNLALDLIHDGVSGRLVNVYNGRYGNIDLNVITTKKKMVEIEHHYNVERLRPHYQEFQQKPLFFIGGD